MRGIRGVVPLAILLLPMGVTACQESRQPGPMERTGAYIDRTVTDAQRGMADFSQRAGQSLDRAGRSVGASAQRAGATLHDRLIPVTDETSPPPPTAWSSQPQIPATGDYSSGGLPKPTRMGP
jgi:hypothetical protein